MNNQTLQLAVAAILSVAIFSGCGSKPEPVSSQRETRYLWWEDEELGRVEQFYSANGTIIQIVGDEVMVFPPMDPEDE